MKYISASKWGASLDPPISATRARKIYHTIGIEGAKTVEIEGKSGRNNHYILIPEDAPDPRQRNESGQIVRGRRVGFSPIDKYNN